ncbi:myotubularin-related protein DDB_G0290005 [Anopheles marshallii]|uniref:myotubularin-related protein DDB_G0290005 n=1 Tax=Anopheles marshallii TaxID=1521116 RepID=UPI00237ACB3C|nr:myotubularin-related protein DDB_G0290005 [Anopheles marshallii]
MWKLKSKLKRKFRSSKIDCNSNHVDYDVPSFESESPARPASEQSDTSVGVPGNSGYHRHTRSCCSAPAVGRGTGGGSASSDNSSLFSYNCCYNYNFHINYNVHHRLPHHLEHHHHNHHNPVHHGNRREGTDDTDGTPFGSTSCMTGLGSESSAELSRKARSMSTVHRQQRNRTGSNASSAKVSSEPDVGNKRKLASENKTATRCLSTSDLSSYKSRSEQRSYNGETGRKGKAPSDSRVRPRSASQRGRADSNENTGTDSVSGDFHAICRRLHAVSLQRESTPPTDPIASRTDLTDHDRRILHCMVLKRIKELDQLEEAVLAKQCWEQEKVFRKSLLDQQERNYRKAIRQKRSIEMIEVRNRKQRLARLEQQQIEKIQDEINEKDLRSASLLKNIEIKKGIRECERRSRELKRLEDATVNQEEKVLDRDIWRQSLVETLEERANRAEGLRRKVMDVYRRRLKIDNQLERKMHAHNLKQTLEQERYKLSLLKERILVRESRFQKFKDSKKRIFDQLKNRAKTTAALRDMVRHTIGPGNSAVVSVSSSNTRPGSVQQQRCGSSARSAGSIAIDAVPQRLLDVVRIK